MLCALVARCYMWFFLVCQYGIFPRTQCQHLLALWWGNAAVAFGNVFWPSFVFVSEKLKNVKYRVLTVTRFSNCFNRGPYSFSLQKILLRRNLAWIEHFSQIYAFFRDLNLAIFVLSNLRLNKLSLFIQYRYWIVKTVLSVSSSYVYH